jgi:hypothetical protein
MLVRVHHVRTLVLFLTANALIHGGGRVALRVVARLGDAVIHLLNIVAPAGGIPISGVITKATDQRNQRRERRQRFAQQAEEGADRQAGRQSKETTPTGLTL